MSMKGYGEILDKSLHIRCYAKKSKERLIDGIECIECGNCYMSEYLKTFPKFRQFREVKERPLKKYGFSEE